AALLHLQISAGADILTRTRAPPSGTLSRSAGEGRNGGAAANPLPHCGRGGTARVSERWVRDGVALRAQLSAIIEHQIDLGERGGAGHDHMAVLAPANVERATVERDRRLPFGQAAAMRRDQGGAGPCAAGAGDADAAFPDPEADVSAIEHCRDADIGAFGEK